MNHHASIRKTTGVTVSNGKNLLKLDRMMFFFAFPFSPRGNDRNQDDKGASNQAWRPKARDEKRGTASPSSSDRRTELNSETADNWRTVEKKRPNP